MLQNHTVITVGEILVEFVSHTQNCGLEIISDYSGPYPSGAPAIFLNQVARMGVPTEMFGGVGKDGFGNAVMNRLKEDGVGVAGISTSTTKSTGVAFVSYYENGSRDFIFHLTNTAADQFQINLSTLDLSKTVLHVSAASLGNPAFREAILRAVHDIDLAGGKITCDPNARPELMRETGVREALTHIMGLSFCLMPSTSDLSYLFPEFDEDKAIDQLLGTNAKIIAIKRGAAGATVVSGDRRYDFQGHSVTEIDPTGAGDCFCGTFIAALVQGASLKAAGQLANAAGAIAVTRRGPMEGNSSLAEITKFRAQSKEASK